MKLTAFFLIGILSCTAMGQVPSDTGYSRIESATVAAFTHDNYFYGSWWQGEYSTESIAYQVKHGITPTAYQSFLDDSALRLGFTLTETFDYVHDVDLIAHLLKTEAIKHKALMDKRHDELYYGGNQPGPFADFLRQQMALIDFAIVEACSLYIWTVNPTWLPEQQLEYLATLLFDSLVAWSIQFTSANEDIREYLIGIGYEIPKFEKFMSPWVEAFSRWWLTVLGDYNRSK